MFQLRSVTGVVQSVGRQFDMGQCAVADVLAARLDCTCCVQCNPNAVVRSWQSWDCLVRGATVIVLGSMSVACTLLDR